MEGFLERAKTLARRAHAGQVVRAAVVLLTRRGTEPDVYYRGIRIDRLALRVKLADIADNADEARLSLLDSGLAARLREKYTAALTQRTRSCR